MVFASTVDRRDNRVGPNSSGYDPRQRKGRELAENWLIQKAPSQDTKSETKSGPEKPVSVNQDEIKEKPKTETPKQTTPKSGGKKMTVDSLSFTPKTIPRASEPLS